jgi:hypothetical protein
MDIEANHKMDMMIPIMKFLLLEIALPKRRLIRDKKHLTREL